jgi:hypothetical protein
MPKFRKKPVVIDAIRNDGQWPTVRDWLIELNPPFGFDFLGTPPITGNGDGSLNITTLEGTMRADVGDFIIKGVKGEFYPCKADIFEATYEPVESDQ